MNHIIIHCPAHMIKFIDSINKQYFPAFERLINETVYKISE